MGWAARCSDTEESTVGIAVVEGDTTLHPTALVQDVGVEPGIHPFSGAAGREGTAPSEKSLESSKGVDIGGRDWQCFECKMDVAESWKHWVGGRWDGREREETACVMRWFMKV